MTLFQKTARSLLAVFGARLVARVIGLASLVVLAAILTPYAFGLVAQVSVATGIVSVLAELGLSAALVFSKELDAETLTAAFVLALAMGSGGSVIVVATAPLMALLFHEPALVALVPIAGLGLVIGSASSVNTTLLERELRFGAIAFLGLLNAGVTAAVSVGMALLGYGVWGLVYGTLAGGASYSVAAWVISPWRLSRHPAWGKLRGLWNYGKHIVASNYIIIAADNVDPIVVGSLLGTTPLGIFTIAWRLGTLVPKNVSSLLNTVMFPAYAQIGKDSERLTRAYRMSMTSLALVAVPFTVFLITLAKPFVLLVLGGPWVAVIAPLQILAISGFFLTIGGAAWNVLLAAGRPKYVSGLNALDLLLSAVLEIAGAILGGLVGLLIGLAVAVAVLNIALMHVTEGLLGGRHGRWLRDLELPMVAVIPMALVSWASAEWVSSPVGSIVLAVALGAPLYAGVVHLVSRGESTRLARRFLRALKTRST